MSTGILWYVVVGTIVLVLTRLLVRPKGVPPPKPKEPPEWHEGHFHDPV